MCMCACACVCLPPQLIHWAWGPDPLCMCVCVCAPVCVCPLHCQGPGVGSEKTGVCGTSWYISPEIAQVSLVGGAQGGDS